MSAVSLRPARSAEWKLRLQREGVAVDRALASRLEAEGRWQALPGGLARVELELSDQVSTLVTLFPEGKNACVRLMEDGSRFLLQPERDLPTEEGVEVHVPAAPSFHRSKTHSGRSMGEIAHLFGSTLVIGGSAACSYGIRASACRYCRVGSRIGSEDGFVFSPREVLETVDAARQADGIHTVLINAGHFDPEDGGLGAIVPLVRGIKRQSSLLVAAQFHPPQQLREIDRAYAIGVDAIGFGLDLSAPGALERHFPGRARQLGRDRYVNALRYAASIFPRGSVWTELIMGFEPTEVTLAAVQEFAALGVIPLLHAPAPGVTPTASAGAGISLEQARELLHARDRSLEEEEIPRWWIDGPSFFLSPRESAQLGRALPLPRQDWRRRLLRGRLGALTTCNLARLRRQLRVQKVDAADLLEE